MKKFGIVTLVLLLLLGGIFTWLLMGASAENAPQDTITIELPDSYEK